MENWGLITGRTWGFLVDSDRADIASKKRVVGYQGHEVAHMWFGNITTPEWWDNLYLNEGTFQVVGSTRSIAEFWMILPRIRNLGMSYFLPLIQSVADEGSKDGRGHHTR